MKQTLIIAIGISAMLFSCKNKNTDVLSASKDSVEAAKIQEAKVKAEADKKVVYVPVAPTHTTVIEKTNTVTTTPTATTTTTTTTKKKGWSKTAKGAVIGAASGAVLGAIVDKKHPGQGAVLGGAVGAAAGAVIGSEKDKKDGRKK